MTNPITITITAAETNEYTFYRDLESLEYGGGDEDVEEDRWDIGDLNFQYLEDGRVVLSRCIGRLPLRFEQVAEGQQAEKLRLNWDELVEFSRQKPTCDKSSLLAFDKALTPQA